ncbi:MAG TPA: ABC transporter permease [Candidatus Limnocylindrales bacterium]|nr:ABC transporter permease [Candidatus Limnocylindrales bacterium]
MTAAIAPTPSTRTPIARPPAPPTEGFLARVAKAYEHQFLLYRRTWRGSLFNSFLSPVLFLLAMGVGLGTYVNRGGGGATLGVPYLVFLAPGLLAATVMQTASFEATFPIMGGFVWQKRYHAMHATPIGPAEIALGQLAWIATRITLVGSIFVLVMVPFGAVQSPLIVLAVPVATLTGLAFATPIAAYAATQKVMTSFNYIFRFAITPLFLFSGAFFPVESLPWFLQPIAWLTPLYHGVALSRSIALGTIAAGPGIALVHLGVLLLYALGGLVLCLIAFQRRLAT